MGGGGGAILDAIYFRKYFQKAKKGVNEEKLLNRGIFYTTIVAS